MTDLLTAALKYAQRGVPVFPCREGGKVPATPNGLKDATRDYGQIAKWWLENPRYNVAFPTGESSGIVVLDIDGDEGRDALADMLDETSDWIMEPDTTSVLTPSGGAHFYFKYPGSRVPNSASKLGPKIDVRGDGGYVLAPPSFNSERNAHYAVDSRLPMVEIPEWLLTMMLGPIANGEVAAHDGDVWLRFFGDGVGEGQRNHRMAGWAGYLLRRYLHLEVVRELCHLVNRTYFKPPLPDWEVNQCVDSICALEQQRRNQQGAQK